MMHSAEFYFPGGPVSRAAANVGSGCFSVHRSQGFYQEWNYLERSPPPRLKQTDLENKTSKNTK